MSYDEPEKSLILASKSAARQDMLRGAGLSFECVPADLDEAALLEGAQNKTPAEMAQILAAAKAKSISVRYPDAVVIGSDQILYLDDTIMMKSRNIEQAREKIRTLRGKTHSLTSGVAVALGGEVLWQSENSAHLTMHDFDDEVLERYIERAGRAGGVLTSCVGGYALEGLGVQLFEIIEGDFFTILGMPLLPLLSYLRTAHGIGL